MKLEMVIPTYKRIEKLRRLLNSITKNDLKFLEIHIYCDNKDYGTGLEIKQRFPFVNILVMDKQYRAFGIWNYHLKNHFYSNGMIYVCDDVEFLPNTLLSMNVLFNQICKNTDGILTFNQYNLESASKYAMGLIGKKFINRFPNNQCFCPDYVSFHADAELGRFAESLGKFYFGNGLKIHHYHPAFYKDEQDEAHAIVRDNQSKIDKEVNRKRRKQKLLWGQSWKLIRKEIIQKKTF